MCPFAAYNKRGLRNIQRGGAADVMRGVMMRKAVPGSEQC